MTAAPSVYVEDEDVPQLDIDVADAYGYLLQVRGGQITIRGALYDGGSGPAPTLEVQDKCAVFGGRGGRTCSGSFGPCNRRQG